MPTRAMPGRDLAVKMVALIFEVVGVVAKCFVPCNLHTDLFYNLGT